MESYSEILRVWPHPTDSEKQICISCFPDSQYVIDLVVNLNPELTDAQFLALLGDERIDNTGVYTRAKQRPRT